MLRSDKVPAHHQQQQNQNQNNTENATTNALRQMMLSSKEWIPGDNTNHSTPINPFHGSIFSAMERMFGADWAVMAAPMDSSSSSGNHNSNSNSSKSHHHHHSTSTAGLRQFLAAARKADGQN